SVAPIGIERVGDPVGFGERAVAGELIGFDVVMRVLNAERNLGFGVAQRKSQPPFGIVAVLDSDRAAGGVIIIAGIEELLLEAGAGVAEVAVDRPSVLRPD